MISCELINIFEIDSLVYVENNEKNVRKLIFQNRPNCCKLKKRLQPTCMQIFTFPSLLELP